MMQGNQIKGKKATRTLSGSSCWNGVGILIIATPTTYKSRARPAIFQVCRIHRGSRNEKTTINTSASPFYPVDNPAWLPVSPFLYS